MSMLRLGSRPVQQTSSYGSYSLPQAPAEPIGYSNPPGYGEQASGSGYGHMRYVDCNAALSVLGFIMFANLLRDIVEDIATTPAGRRRKRSTSSGVQGSSAGFEDSSLPSSLPTPDILSFLYNGGMKQIKLFVPLAFQALFDVGTSPPLLPCLQQSLCGANLMFAKHLGTTGRLIATWFSNMVTQYVYPDCTHSQHELQTAARNGRRGDTCNKLYTCSAGSGEKRGNRAEQKAGARNRRDTEEILRSMSIYGHY